MACELSQILLYNSTERISKYLDSQYASFSKYWWILTILVQTAWLLKILLEINTDGIGNTKD